MINHHLLWQDLSILLIILLVTLIGLISYVGSKHQELLQFINNQEETILDQHSKIIELEELLEKKIRVDIKQLPPTLQ